MGGRVLVVEDHSMSLELVTELLQQEGHQVLAATSGEAGLRLAETEQPDLILMDLQLPAAIPVLALTRSAMWGEDLRAREAGCDGYLTRPLDARAFRETLRRILTGGNNHAPDLRSTRG